MDIESLLDRHRCKQYFNALKQEAIDVGILSVLSPADLRLFCGIPLGHAVKLVRDANEGLVPLQPQGEGPSEPATLEKLGEFPSEVVGAPARVSEIDSLLEWMSRVNSSFATAAACERVSDDRSLDSLLERMSRVNSSFDTTAACERISDDRSEIMHDVVKEQLPQLANTLSNLPDTLIDPGMESQPSSQRSKGKFMGSPASDVSSFRKLIRIVWTMVPLMHPIDLLIPGDHSETFKLCWIHAKTGKEMKDYLSVVAQTWVLMLSLLLGVIAEVWSCPDESGETSKLVFELLFQFAFLLTYLSLSMWAVLVVVSSGIHHVNMKEFCLASLGILQYIELCLVLAVYTTLAAFVYLCYLRLEVVSPDSWWPFCVMACVPGFLIPCAILVVNAAGLLAIHSGCMTEIPICTSTASGPVECEREVFNAVGESCLRRPSRVAAVDHCFQVQLNADRVLGAGLHGIARSRVLGCVA